jgi:hypothetical protein
MSRRFARTALWISSTAFIWGGCVSSAQLQDFVRSQSILFFSTIAGQLVTTSIQAANG